MGERDGMEALPLAIAAIARWFERSASRRTLEDVATPLSSTEAWLLERISMSEGFRMSELAKWHSVDRSTMTSHIRGLERRALIERLSDDLDRRVVLVAATDAGHAAVRDARAAAAEVFDDLVSGWRASDRAELTRLLEKLAATVEERQASD